MLPIPDVHPGCTTVVQVVVDHTRWPFPGPPLDPTKELQAFSFGLTLPPPLQYVSHTFNGTHLQQMIQGNPWYASVRPVTGGITVGIVLDSQMKKSMPEGTSQIIIKITVSVPAGTPSQQRTLNFSGSLGDPDVPLDLVMRGGSFVPAVQPRTVNITPGTCVVPRRGNPAYAFRASAVGMPSTELEYYPAIAAGLTVPSIQPLLQFSEETPATGDAAAEGETALEETTMEEPPDPATLEFPAPTEGELEVHPSGQASPLSETESEAGEAVDSAIIDAEMGVPAVVAAGAGGSSQSLLSGADEEICNWEARIPALPPAAATAGYFYHFVPSEWATIQMAIDDAAADFTDDDDVGDHVIVVAPGTYAEDLIIDTNAFVAPSVEDFTLTIRAETSPDDTIITGAAGDDRIVLVIGGLAPGEDGIRVVLGGSSVDCSQGCIEDPPIIDACENPLGPSHVGWHGFTIGPATLDFGDGGISVESTTNSVAIVGNVIRNGSGAMGSTFDADAGGINVFEQDTGDEEVVIILNEIRGNKTADFGGGIGIRESNAIVAKNWIFANGFNIIETGTFALQGGGGLSFQEANAPLGAGESLRLHVCDNWFYCNKAIQGAGLYISTGLVEGGQGDSTTEQDFDFLLYKNQITENSANIPPVGDYGPDNEDIVYQGGGIYIDVNPSLNLVPVSPGYYFRILQNRIYTNDIRGGRWYVDSLIGENKVVGQGGGIYMQVDLDVFRSSEEVDPAIRATAFVNNAIYNNSADSVGGGVVLGAYRGYPVEGLDFPPPGLNFYHNTITYNKLDFIDRADPMLQPPPPPLVPPEEYRGVGVFLPYDSDPLIEDVPHVDAINNIVFRGTPENAEWCAEADTTPPPEPVDRKWRDSILRDLFSDPQYVNACPTGADLFSAAEAYDDEDADPSVVGPFDPHVSGLQSPAVDDATPLEILLSAGASAVYFDCDFDGESRPFGAGPDIGCDETLFVLIHFRRGDADGNGIVNALVDALYILNYQFNAGPGPPCFDGADVDGNNVFNAFLDALFLLSYQFNAGPVPPAPGPNDCGPDPDSDVLVCPETTDGCP